MCQQRSIHSPIHQSSSVRPSSRVAYLVASLHVGVDLLQLAPAEGRVRQGDLDLTDRIPLNQIVVRRVVLFVVCGWVCGASRVSAAVFEQGSTDTARTEALPAPRTTATVGENVGAIVGACVGASVKSLQASVCPHETGTS